MASSVFLPPYKSQETPDNSQELIFNYWNQKIVDAYLHEHQPSNDFYKTIQALKFIKMLFDNKCKLGLNEELPDKQTFLHNKGIRKRKFNYIVRCYDIVRAIEDFNLLQPDKDERWLPINQSMCRVIHKIHKEQEKSVVEVWNDIWEYCKRENLQLRDLVVSRIRRQVFKAKVNYEYKKDTPIEHEYDTPIEELTSADEYEDDSDEENANEEDADRTSGGVQNAAEDAGGVQNEMDANVENADTTSGGVPDESRNGQSTSGVTTRSASQSTRPNYAEGNSKRKRSSQGGGRATKKLRTSSGKPVKTSTTSESNSETGNAASSSCPPGSSTSQSEQEQVNQLFTCLHAFGIRAHFGSWNEFLKAEDQNNVFIDFTSAECNVMEKIPEDMQNVEACVLASASCFQYFFLSQHFQSVCVCERNGEVQALFYAGKRPDDFHVSFRPLEGFFWDKSDTTPAEAAGSTPSRSRYPSPASRRGSQV